MGKKSKTAKDTRSAPKIAAGFFLHRHHPEGDRYLLLRSTKHLEWGFPKGHLDDGESPLEAAFRESWEETGIRQVKVVGHAREIHYTLRSGRHKRAIYFPALTRESQVALSKEHCDYRWVDCEETHRLLNHGSLQKIFANWIHQHDRGRNAC